MAPSQQWIVQVVEYATDKVVKALPAKTQREADRLDGGLNVNLNHERFFTRIVEPSPSTKPGGEG